MSIFDKLKRMILNKESGVSNQELTVYFKNGLLLNIVPMPQGNLYDNRDIYYNARYIVSDGQKYDLENFESIKSIYTPNFDNFDNSELGITGNLVYILRMKASQLKKDGKTELALTLLKKATEMMPVSLVEWTKRDYMRFYDWLCEAGEFEAANQAKKCVDDLFETTLNYNEIVHQKNMENAESLGTDLVEAEYFRGCCGECAKYRGRWFSISGRDKRFPKMPVDYGCTCSGLTFYPVVYGASEPDHCPKSKDIIEYSNRPFIDDRSKKEKEIYQHDIDSEVFEEIKCRDKEDYEKLMQLIPDEMPKSFSAYRRMKMGETDRFMNIAEKATALGLDIILSEEDKVIIKRYNEFEKALKENKK